MQNLVFTQLSIPEIRNLIREIQTETNQELLDKLFAEIKQIKLEKTERYISKREAAFIGDVCTSTIDNWIRIGYIKKYKLGDMVRVKYSELMNYMDSMVV